MLTSPLSGRNKLENLTLHYITRQTAQQAVASPVAKGAHRTPESALPCTNSYRAIFNVDHTQNEVKVLKFSFGSCGDFGTFRRKT